MVVLSQMCTGYTQFNSYQNSSGFSARHTSTILAFRGVHMRCQEAAFYEGFAFAAFSSWFMWRVSTTNSPLSSLSTFKNSTEWWRVDYVPSFLKIQMGIDLVPCSPPLSSRFDRSTSRMKNVIVRFLHRIISIIGTLPWSLETPFCIPFRSKHASVIVE